jgi:hypothetical protein
VHRIGTRNYALVVSQLAAEMPLLIVSQFLSATMLCYHLHSLVIATTRWRVWGATVEKFQNDFLSIHEHFSGFSSHVTVRKSC